MLIEPRKIQGKKQVWTLRCPTILEAGELSKLRVLIDGETENLYREPGEDVLTTADFEKRIQEDILAERTLFLVAEVEGRLAGFARCEGKTLNRFKHTAEFGICVAKEFWGLGIGKVLLESILNWADSAGLEKIVLDVMEENKNAIELYKAYGFVEEGLLIKDRKHKDGKYHNTVVMGRFAEKCD